MRNGKEIKVRRKIAILSEDIIAYIISCIVALIFGFNSPLHPWVGSESSIDSSVFKTVALMMERGYMPYRDSFDHKGPVLYILNWIGNRISQYRGIWLIEIICISFTFWMLYKISRLKCSVISSIITCFTAISLLFVYFEGGNFTEEYAMPCIAVSIYIFLDYLLNGVISNARVIISGICCGVVMMLRANMISIWIVYCLAISCVLLSRKAISKWGNFAVFFLCGLAITIVPILAWLLVNDDISYFINDYVLFNMQYSSVEGGRAVLSAKWSSFFEFFNTTVYLVAFCSIIFHLKEILVVNISYAIYLILTVILMVMSGMSYGHYGMILVPAVIYPISLLFSDIEKITEANQRKTLLMLTSLYFLSIIIIPSWVTTVDSIPMKYEKKGENNRYELTNNLVNLIEKLTDEDDKISVYGNWDVIYVLSDRAHATRYSYQYPIGQVMPEIVDEYLHELQEEMPKIIVVCDGNYDDRIRNFLDENNYKLQFASNTEDLNESAMLFLKQ